MLKTKTELPYRRHDDVFLKIQELDKIAISVGSHKLLHLMEIGEDISEYKSIWGYSLGETETRMPIYEYPSYDFQVTDEITNLKLE